jgi:hypothetical protein
MLLVPAFIPVATPGAVIIEAIVVEPLCHVPPAVAEVSVVEVPVQIANVPLIGLTIALTVTLVFLKQVLADTYLMLVTPVATPVTIPTRFTDAPVGLLVTHVPPRGVPESVTLLPAQTKVGPVTLGIAPTVTTAEALQPEVLV